MRANGDHQQGISIRKQKATERERERERCCSLMNYYNRAETSSQFIISLG